MPQQTFPFPLGTVHIIGIGGIGMSGYAEVLHNLGYKVQGSDQAHNANVQRLIDLGVRVMVGHHAQNVFCGDHAEPAAVIVRSTAVKDDNPEIAAARKLDIPVIARVDLLAELMRWKWCVNVSGTHGKTTTTSMIGHMLEKAGLDPTVINGGIINAYGSNTRMGKGNWMVVEADESDGTFAHLPSVASVVTNIDPEHLDHYGDFDAMKEAFIAYAHNLPFYGTMIACIDHPVVAELLPRFDRRTITYGFSDRADIQAVNVETVTDGLRFDLVIDPFLKNFPREVKDVRLPMFGRHNVLNVMATFALGHELRLEAGDIARHMASFAGVKRRFTVTGTANGVTVIDDYAHHPVEIAAVLQAGRDALAARGGGRLIAVVQPHRYSRLSALFDPFAACFDLADSVIVAEVYAAGEKPLEKYNHDTLADAIRKTGKTDVAVLPSAADLSAMVAARAAAGDMVICLGAGNITQWAQALPAQLEGKKA